MQRVFKLLVLTQMTVCSEEKKTGEVEVITKLSLKCENDE